MLDAFMSVEMSRLGETLATDITQVGPLPSVRSQVPHAVTTSPKIC